MFGARAGARGSTFASDVMSGEMATGETHNSITLRLQGSKATRGVPLATFETFIDNFLAALRYHYRATALEPAKKAGRPYAKEELVTAFRLVGFRIGSGIAVLEPTTEEADDPVLAQVPTLALDNLTSLITAVKAGQRIDTAVVDALETARRALGAEGRFDVSVGLATDVAPSPAVSLDEELLNQLRVPAEETARRSQTISGNLHAIDLEPDKVGIRTPSGADWSCRYPEHLEPLVKSLIGSTVWARGVGALTSARSGSLELEEIQAVPQYEQTSLFTGEPVPLDELLARQEIIAPQGLKALADPEWEDNEESERFLEAIFGTDGE